MRVNCLISDRVVIQTLHHIYFASRRPFGIFGQQPDSRPCSFCGIQFGAYFDTSVKECLFTFGINASCQIRCRIIGQCLIDNTPQYQFAFTHGKAGIKVRHIIIPVGPPSRNLAPDLRVKAFLLIKILFPYQRPAGGRSSCRFAGNEYPTKE